MMIGSGARSDSSISAAPRITSSPPQKGRVRRHRRQASHARLTGPASGAAARPDWSTGSLPAPNVANAQQASPKRRLNPGKVNVPAVVA